LASSQCFSLNNDYPNGSFLSVSGAGAGSPVFVLVTGYGPVFLASNIEVKEAVCSGDGSPVYIRAVADNSGVARVWLGWMAGYGAPSAAGSVPWYGSGFVQSEFQPSMSTEVGLSSIACFFVGALVAMAFVMAVGI
jgi:hypothetical protein